MAAWRRIVYGTVLAASVFICLDGQMDRQELEGVLVETMKD